MSELIKKRIINELAHEILYLSPKDIELVGHNYVSLRENRELIHHGINLDYKPVSHTVDSFSEDSSIIAEYSTEAGYFEHTGKADNPTYQKIFDDIDHAFSHVQPDKPEVIYLVSNQMELPSFRKKFNGTAYGLKYKDTLRIIDARLLAESIYTESLKNPKVADSYKFFFPTFSQNLDNYEYYGKLPGLCASHTRDLNTIEAIQSRFDSGKQFLVLCGVSGAGKTQAAIDYVRYNDTKYPNQIWIDGADWKPSTSLASIQRSRGGSPVNVAGLFNSDRTILVIDNLERGIDASDLTELNEGFSKQGVVLITSQTSTLNNESYLAKPEIPFDVACEILGETPDNVTAKATEFIKKCSFCPLILAIIRKFVSEKKVQRENIYREILNDPSLVDDDTGISIIKKMLSKLEEKKFLALKEIANSGINSHDISFLRHFIGAFNCNTLQKLSILVPDNLIDIYRIHDLISDAVKDQVKPENLVCSIEKYMKSQNGNMTASVVRQIHLSVKQLHEENTLRGIREIDWLQFALLQIDGQNDGFYKQFVDLDINSDSSLIVIKTVVDSKEAHSYTIANSKEREIFYRKCVDLYDAILVDVSDKDIKSEILHHKGKALRRSNQDTESLATFRQLLELEPTWLAIHGQIAHLGTQRNVQKPIKNAGQTSMKILIDDIVENQLNAPLRVSLASIARLRSYRSLVKELENDPDSIRKIAMLIETAAMDGLGQFYEAFCSFTSMFGYKHGSICVNLAESVPAMISTPPEQIENIHWTSACEALINCSVFAEAENKADLSLRLMNASMLIADAVYERGNLSSYETRCISKVFRISGKPDRALQAFDKIKDEPNSWLLYEKARLLVALGSEKNQEAMETAKICVDQALAENIDRDRLPPFYSLLSECHETLGHYSDAIRVLELAIEECTDKQYGSELEGKHSLLLEKR